MTDQNTPSISELQQKANEGDAQAQFNLGCCYATNTDIEKNNHLAFEWIQKAAEQGLVDAQLFLGLSYSIERLIQNDENKDILIGYWTEGKSFKPQWLFALKPNESASLSFKWFQEASIQNCIDAQYWLAFLYYEGVGTKQDYQQAFEWFKKSADQGFVYSYKWISYFYLLGKGGIKRNNELSCEWFKKAETSFLSKRLMFPIDAAKAQHELACYYLEVKEGLQNYGLGFVLNEKFAMTDSQAKKYPEAKRWLEEQYIKFADIHFDDDRFTDEDKVVFNHQNCGNTSYYGSYNLKDCRAFEPYEMAAENGSENAKNWLAESKAKFTQIDFDDAKFAQDDVYIFWLTKAAKQNNVEAQFRLALFYLEGKRGVNEAGMDTGWDSRRKGMEWLVEASLNKYQAADEWIINACLPLPFPHLVGKEDADVSYKFAFEWCRKKIADDPNSSEVLMCLGLLYLLGKGVEQNEDLALDCFHKIDYYDIDGTEMYSLAAFFMYLKKEDFTFVSGYGLDYVISYVNDIFMRGKFYKSQLLLPDLMIEILCERNEFHLLGDLLHNTDDDIIRDDDIVKARYDRAFSSLIDTMRRKYLLDKELQEKNRRLEEKEKELEDMMSMFAHKFRSPLDAIIYNTQHDNQVELYTEAAQTMRGLLNIFSIISTDTDILKDKIKQDNQGSGNLEAVFCKTLDMILLHLLSVSGAEKIQQHYLGYAKAQGQCDTQVSYKTWCEEYFELEQTMQAEWEASYAQLLKQSPTLEQRLAWLEEHFFKLEFIGYDRADIQFKEYGTTESLLTILLNEILVNVFKYYSSESKQAVVLEWVEREGYQVLICRNPSIRSERTIIKGSHKGHVFLSTLARKTDSLFNKPIPQDDFVLEFGLPNELLISK